MSRLLVQHSGQCTEPIGDCGMPTQDAALPQPPHILRNAHVPGTHFKDPRGTTWLKRSNEDGVGPLQQVLDRARSEGHTFVAACDSWVPAKSNSMESDCVKMYGSYVDARAFLTETLLRSTARFLYEVIPLGAVCKLYWDLEWVGGTCDDAGIRIRDLVSALDKYITAKLGIKTRFVVLCGTRRTGGGDYKHSYHIVCVDVVFESNTQGMKAFVEGFIGTVPENNSFLQVLDGDGTVQKCIVDTAVYNKNRCLRTQLSSKLGDPTATTLDIVWLDKDGTWHKKTDLTDEEYLASFVTRIDDSFDRSKIVGESPAPPCPLAAASSGSGKMRHLGGGSRSSMTLQPTEEDSILVPMLQSIVDARGGVGCQVCALHSISPEGTRTFLCRNHGERWCLTTPGARHVNNHCFVTINRIGIVRYGCHASECMGTRPVQIGELQVNVNRKQLDGVHVDGRNYPMDIDEDNLVRKGKVGGGGSGQLTDRSGKRSKRQRLAYNNDSASGMDEAGGNESGGDSKLVDSGKRSKRQRLADNDHSASGMDEASGADGADSCSEGGQDDKADGGSEGGDGGGDDDEADGGEADGDSNDDMGHVEVRHAKLLTGVSFPSNNGGSNNLLISDVESLVTFFEDPDQQNACKVLTASAGGFRPNRGGRYARGVRTQTEPIRVGHLEPPVDKGDERPIDHRLELYVAGLKRSNTSSGRMLGVCQAIRDACRHNDDVEPKALMSLFRKKQRLGRGDPRLSPSPQPSPFSGMEGAVYALPLLRHLYVKDNQSQRFVELEGYPVVKARAETEYIKIERPTLFLQLNVDGRGKLEATNREAIKVNYENKYYYEHLQQKKKEEKSSEDAEDAIVYEAIELPFVPTWLKDREILTAQRICCDPALPMGLVPVLDGMAYNTWPGFQAEKLPPVSKSVEEEAMTRFHDHILKCVREVEVATFMMDYFANIFQRPWAKTQVAILLQGVEGCGKGTIFDTIRAVMGDGVSYQTGKPNQDLFSRFSVGFKNKVLVQIDEAKDLFMQDDQIKNVITAETMEFEDKNVKPYTLDLHANIVVTTNNRHPVKISHKERRWVLVKSTEGFAQDSSYFTPLRAFLKRLDTLRGLYQGFMARDISHITNFQSCRPKTDYYRMCVKAYAPLHTRFLSSVALSILGDGKQMEDIPAAYLFKLFQEWAKGANYQFTYNLNSFSDLMQEFMKHEGSGISKKHTTRCFVYSIVAADLKECLKRREEFDDCAGDAYPISLHCRGKT